MSWLDGCTYMGSGLEVQQCNRGQVGVGLLLSRSATAAWEAAGKLVYREGARVIAAPLKTKGLELSILAQLLCTHL